MDKETFRYFLDLIEDSIRMYETKAKNCLEYPITAAIELAVAMHQFVWL